MRVPTSGFLSHFSKKSICILTLLILSGCSSFQTPNHSQTDASSIETSSASLFEIRSHAATLFNTFKRKDLEIYTPHYFDQAQSAFKTIDNPLTEESAASLQLDRIEKTYKRAIELKKKVETEFKETAIAYKRLRSLKLQGLYPAQVESLRQRWYQLVINIERIPKATPEYNQEALRQKEAMDFLVKNSMKDTMLIPLEAAFQQLASKKVNQIAPKSFKEAQEAMDLLKKNIHSNPSNLELLTATHGHAQRTIKRAENVGTSVRTLSNLSPKEAEKQVVFMSELLHQIGVAMGEEDHRHLGLKMQAKALTQAAEVQRKRASLFGNEDEWASDRETLLQRIRKLEKQLQSSPKSQK